MAYDPRQNRQYVLKQKEHDNMLPDDEEEVIFKKLSEDFDIDIDYDNMRFYHGHEASYNRAKSH